MFLRTLHFYILRELLRVFLMTASTLTTLLAFGGMFKPLTKQGVDISQVMVLMINLMPAMLAYAIPIAALFAAVLVYWRLSTDNELTACRAGGISFLSIVIPALLLGLSVASMDYGFVNYVVPRFLQSTERAVRSDLGTWIKNQITRQEKFQSDMLPLVVSADSADLEPSGDPNVSTVLLHGMAAAQLDHDRPTSMVIAQEARIVIRNIPDKDAAEISFNLTNSSIFDPTNGFRKASASIDSNIFNGKPFIFSSYFKNKPKYLNWRDLIRLHDDPYLFTAVGDTIDKIEIATRYQAISANVQNLFHVKGDHAITFDGVDIGGNGKILITLYASQAVINNDAAPRESLTFKGKPVAGTGTMPATQQGGVKIEQRVDGRLITTYTCDAADLVLSIDGITDTSVSTQLRLHDHVQREANDRASRPVVTDTSYISISLDPSLTNIAPASDKPGLVRDAASNPNKNVRKLGQSASEGITNLFQTIVSELHSRGSFSLSCLTLVMLGAALGIMMRGRNPLAVFVVGFVPAILLVVLITAGRQLTEGDIRNETAGVVMIWAGNGILLILVTSVYAKLLRQ